MELLAVSKSIYMADITVGEEPQQRGNWADRLSAMDQDIDAVSRQLETASAVSPLPAVTAAIQEALGRPRRWTPAVRHEAAKLFHAGEPLRIVLSSTEPGVRVRLYYRHVDQAERYVTTLMEPKGNEYYGTIPADYTNSEYPLEYYFEIRGPAKVALYPGFSSTLVNQPYFVVRKS